MKISSLSTLVLVFATCTSMIASNSPFTVSVGRPLKPMDTYLYRTQFSEEYKVYTRNEKKDVTQETNTIVVTLVADAEVQAVTQSGEEQAKFLTIRLFRFKRDSLPHVDYLHTGARVKIEFAESGVPSFTIDKKPVADSVAMVLAQIVHAEGGAKTGRILNPAKPVRYGNTWQMNVRELLATIDQSEIKIHAKRVKSSVKLERADSVKGKGMYTVVGDVSADKVMPGGFDALRVLNAKLMLRVSVTVPEDERYPAYETSSVLALDVPAKSKPDQGPPMDYQIRITRQQESRFER